MDTVCHGWDFAFVYIDDILVGSKDIEHTNNIFACCSSDFKSTAWSSTSPRACLVVTLFEALTGKTKTLVWDETMVKAFHDTKKAFAEATLLTHPRHDVPISLTTDASDQAVGAVLQQFVNGSWEPLAFFSKC